MYPNPLTAASLPQHPCRNRRHYIQPLRCMTNSSSLQRGQSLRKNQGRSLYRYWARARYVDAFLTYSTVRRFEVVMGGERFTICDGGRDRDPLHLLFVKVRTLGSSISCKAVMQCTVSIPPPRGLACRSHTSAYGWLCRTVALYGWWTKPGIEMLCCPGCF